MTNERERLVLFERCLNFRDLGGYAAGDGRKVRWGRLYRSMTPQFMTEGDIRHAVDDLGVRRVLDLRDRPEADSGPLGRPPNQRHVAKFAEFAKFPEVRDLPAREVLPKHLDYSAAGIARAFEVLADDPGGATVFHCQTGKDRTGVLAAIILRLLGVSADAVVADYMLGAELVSGVQAIIDALGPQPFAPPRSALEGLDERAIRAVIARLDDEFGGARAYLGRIGVPDEAIARFVADMLV
jgi:protein-tyrosine phosphatase